MSRETREARIAEAAFNAGVKQAYSDVGYYAPQSGMSMGATSGRAQPATVIEAPPRKPPRRKTRKAPPAPPEIPGMSDLISSIKLQDFADLPDDYMIQDPRMAEQLMATGQQYVDQLRQYYAYLVTQGMAAQDAMNASRQLVNQEFKRFSVK